MTTKRQQTMAKMTRERAVREKREKKMEKKRAAAAERKARAAGLPFTPAADGRERSGDDLNSPALLDPHLTDGDDRPVLGESVVESSGDDADSPTLLDPHLADGDDGPVLSEGVVSGL